SDQNRETDQYRLVRSHGKLFSAGGNAARRRSQRTAARSLPRDRAVVIGRSQSSQDRAVAGARPATGFSSACRSERRLLLAATLDQVAHLLDRRGGRDFALPAAGRRA